MSENTIDIEIRSFPLLGVRGHRYPVSYMEGGQLKIISMPIGSSYCSPGCYAHPDYYGLEKSLSDKKCPVCKNGDK